MEAAGIGKSNPAAFYDGKNFVMPPGKAKNRNGKRDDIFLSETNNSKQKAENRGRI